MEAPDATTLPGWLDNLRRKAEDDGWTTTIWGEIASLPLLALTRSARCTEAPRVYLSAGIHGDESAGPLAVDRLITTGVLSRAVHWTVVPLLNPIGWIRRTRENAAGVDLNRDYQFMKQPETRGHAAFLRDRPPNDLFLSLHEDWEVSGFYLYELNGSKYPSIGTAILRAVESIVPLASEPTIDDHTLAEPGWIRHPVDPDEPEKWPEAIFHQRQYPHLSYTFETPSSQFPIERRVDAHATGVDAALREFLRASTSQ